MRKSMNYVLAAAVFALVMVMMTGGSFGIVAASYMIGVLLEGQEGFARASAFLLEHQNLFSCLLYLIPASVFIPWLYLERTGKQGAARFAASQTEKLSPVCFVWTAVLIYAVQHAVSIIIGFLAVLLPEAVEHYSELVEAAGMTQYSPVWVVSMLILPPLVEETVFRGLIMEYLRKGGACFWAANVIQAFLFGVYHGNLVQGIYAFCIGLLFGYLSERYGSLIITMAAHALFNLLGTLGVEIESMLLPELLQGLLIFGCVPVAAAALVLIHYGAGDRKYQHYNEKREEH